MSAARVHGLGGSQGIPPLVVPDQLHRGQNGGGGGGGTVQPAAALLAGADGHGPADSRRNGVPVAARLRPPRPGHAQLPHQREDGGEDRRLWPLAARPLAAVLLRYGQRCNTHPLDAAGEHHFQPVHDHVGRVGLRRLLVGDLLLRPPALLRDEPRGSGPLPPGRRHPPAAAVRHVRHLRRHAILLAQFPGRSTLFPAASRPARRHRRRSLSAAQLRSFTSPPLNIIRRHRRTCRSSVSSFDSSLPPSLPPFPPSLLPSLSLSLSLSFSLPDTMKVSALRCH